MRAEAEQAEAAKAKIKQIEKLLAQLQAEDARMQAEAEQAEAAKVKTKQIQELQSQLHAKDAQMQAEAEQAKSAKVKTMQIRDLEAQLHAMEARMQAAAQQAEAAMVNTKQIRDPLRLPRRPRWQYSHIIAEVARLKQLIDNEYRARAQMQAEEKVAEEHMADDTRDADLGSQQAEDSLEDEEDLQGAEKDEREHRGDEDSVQKRARHA